LFVSDADQMKTCLKLTLILTLWLILAIFSILLLNCKIDDIEEYHIASFHILKSLVGNKYIKSIQI